VTRIRARAIGIVVVAVALLVAPSIASATPEVKLKAGFAPIPGVAHTGDILGAGTALEVDYTISGTEYQGSPPPLLDIDFFLPSKVKPHAKGFPTCARATLEEAGTSECPKGSAAGPTGSGRVYITFGSERVEESTQVSAFYEPGGGLAFYNFGTSPSLLEFAGGGPFVNPKGAGGFGAELETSLPLLESVPGAPFVSFKSISVKFGSEITSKGKETFYLKVPKKCPTAGFQMQAEVTFARNGEASEPETVNTAYTAPCPRT
jgi:hypothetical protein